MRWPKIPILPLPFVSIPTASSNARRSTPARIAARSVRARSATASITSPPPSTAAGPDSRATASSRSASCSSEKPGNPTRTANRTTAALLTPTLVAKRLGRLERRLRVVVEELSGDPPIVRRQFVQVGADPVRDVGVAHARMLLARVPGRHRGAGQEDAPSSRETPRAASVTAPAIAVCLVR